jgi:hypothetical protein
MNEKERALLVISLVGLAILIAVAVNSAQQNNQIVRPVPDAAPAPVVPQLPDIIAYLQGAKSSCEGRVQLVKSMGRERRLSKRETDHAQQLYISVKQKHDSCLAFMKAALVRRFNNDDPQKIYRQLQEINLEMMSFTSWADAKINPNMTGAAGPLGELLDHLNEWLTGTSKENESAIQNIIRQLDDCRLADWNSIN